MTVMQTQMPTHIAERFEKAFAEQDPTSALLALARALQQEGVGQGDLYCLFEAYHIALPGDAPHYDAVSDTLGAIYSGGWGGANDLFEGELPDAELQAARARAQGRQV